MAITPSRWRHPLSEPTEFPPLLEQVAQHLLTGLLAVSSASKAYLIVADGDALVVVGRETADETADFSPQPLASCGLPESAIRYCRTQGRGVLSGSPEDPPSPTPEGSIWVRWTNDPPSPRKWVCLPLLLSKTCPAVCYLEGESEARFDPDRLCRFLSGALAQAASGAELAALTAERDRLAELVRERSAMLELAEKELVRRERLATLGQLIATVSHELRNPLGTVRGSVFLIANKLLGKDLGVERALDRAERNIVRCDRIIEDLLAYTRSHDLELEMVRIDRWLDNTLEEYSFPHDVTVRVTLRANVIMKVEPERLRRCLVNLINNACDAMKAGTQEEEDGTKRLTVLSKANVKKRRLELIIADSGPGIPAEELGKILEPLYSTKSFGVGLGLPTVVQILEQHQGGLEIKSIVGQGTAMTMWIPFNEHSKHEDGSPITDEEEPAAS